MASTSIIGTKSIGINEVLKIMKKLFFTADAENKN